MEQKVEEAMKLKLQDKLKDNVGFTIVELMLAALLMFVVVSGVSLTYFTSANATEDIISSTTSEIDARVAMYRISKDIREAISIEEASSDGVKFISNVDSDEEFEEVYYYLEYTEYGHYNLYRKVDDGPEKIIAVNVINGSEDFLKYYTDEGDNNLSSPVDESELDSIKRVDINIFIDQEEPYESSRTMHLKTSVALRNRT